MLLSKIIKHINEVKGPDAYHFQGICGPLSEREGVECLVKSNDVAVVGLTEVFTALPKILNAIALMRKQLKSDPQSLLCVDTPDLNFILAEMAHKNKKPVDYIIAPQVWATRSGRIAKMKKWVRRLYPALTFEQELFQNNGVDAKYLGHPIRESLEPRNRKLARSEWSFTENDFVFGLFPGSRGAEISRNFPLMIEAWSELKKYSGLKNFQKNYKGLLSIARGRDLDSYLKVLNSSQKRKFQELIDSKEWQLAYHSHMAMMAGDFAWVTSGTATLEAAFYQLPHILIYKMNSLSVFILKLISSYFSDPDSCAGLPNILLGKRVIPEILQNNLHPRRLAVESIELLMNPIQMKYLQRQLKWIPRKLGDPGAANRIAEDLLNLWEKN